jgi:hypothetical protein
MAKKMQRLDESPDFRPFKFRIQAFTNAFLEEVRRLCASRRDSQLSYPPLFSSLGKDILKTKYL